MGRTSPSVLTCELDDGSFVEVVAKFSAGCEQGCVHLAREVIAAPLAADLGLPVPEPFLVHIPDGWIETVPDQETRVRIARSSPIGFGSKLMTGQYSAWGNGNLISATMLPMAAAIFAFDALMQNPDRRVGNPNCLVKGDELRIFDHEFAFSHGLMIGWQPPWALGGLRAFETNGDHIFYEGLKGKSIDFGPIRASWTDLSDEAIRSYADGLSVFWENIDANVAQAETLIANVRTNIEGCLVEIGRVLA